MATWYHRYVIVSQYQTRSEEPEREAALTWLQRQMTWERVLNRLRNEAGIGVPAPAVHDQVVPDRPAA